MERSINLSEHSYESLVEYVNANIPDSKNFELRGEFAADYAQSKVIRDVVSYLLQRNHVKPPWDRRFALVTDELVNNSIEHGSIIGDRITFLIRFETVNDSDIQITMEIADAGRGEHAKSAAEMEEIRNRKVTVGFEKYRENRGRGLFQIIVRLVDTLYFSDNPGGGLIVGITKKLDAEILDFHG